MARNRRWKRGTALDQALRSGGQILIDQLVAQGVERVYCVPGESYLAALDAMNNTPIELTVCRQEAGAAIMALTEGRLTGRPGICFVTRGPGATNAAHGVHIAEHDSAPMILFIGQVERAMMGRGAFQEMDYRALFASTTKLATQIETAAQIPEVVQRAFHVAMQGRPGPVAIALPEDMLTEMAGVADAPRVEPVPIWPGLTQMAELQKMLWAANRPIAILGGAGWTKRASAAFARFAERFDLPVTGSFRRSSAFDGEHDNFAGEVGLSINPKLKARVEAADLVLLVGGRMSEAASQGYTLFGIPAPKQRLVHVHADAHEIGRNYHPDARNRRHDARVLRRARRRRAAVEDPLVGRDARRAGRLSRLERAGAAESGPGAIERDHVRDPTALARRHLHQRRRQLLDLGRPFPALSRGRAAIGPDVGLDGFRPAGGDRRAAPLSQADGRLLRRRRRFSDERAGIRDRRAIWPADHRGPDRQRHVRHDPHASGAHVSRPGRRRRRCAIPISRLTRAPSAATARRWRRRPSSCPHIERALASGLPSILHVKVDPDAITPTTTLSAIRAQALEKARQPRDSRMRFRQSGVVIASVSEAIQR